MDWIVVPKENKWNTVSFILFNLNKVQFSNVDRLALVYRVIVDTISYVFLVWVCFQYLVPVLFRKHGNRVIILAVVGSGDVVVGKFGRSYKYLPRKCLGNRLCFTIHIDYAVVKDTGITECHGHFLVHFLNVKVLVKILLCILADIDVLECTVDAVEEWPNLGLCYLTGQCIDTGLDDID